MFHETRATGGLLPPGSKSRSRPAPVAVGRASPVSLIPAGVEALASAVCVTVERDAPSVTSDAAKRKVAERARRYREQKEHGADEV
jgi:hypothetical protein